MAGRVGVLGLLWVGLAIGANVPTGTTLLPVIHLETGKATLSEVGIRARLGISDLVGGNRFTDSWNRHNGFVDVNFHGSSSGGMAKKSYALELIDSLGNQVKAPLLGMSSESDWVLVASYPDKSLIRNALGYTLSAATGQYAPRTRLVELVVNGGYEGVYLLVERVARDANRVDVPKLGAWDDQGDDLTGGYILRIDRSSDSNGWVSERDAQVYIQYYYPKDVNITAAQKQYIQTYLAGFESLMAKSAIAGASGYAAWIDVGSFADYLLSQELMRNTDGYRLSAFLSKLKESQGGRLRAGPVWDLDITFGIGDYYDGWNPTGWVYSWSAKANKDGFAIPAWWPRLARDSAFKARLNCRYQQLRAGKWSNTAWRYTFDSLAALAGSAQVRNFARWDILKEKLWPEVYVPGTYKGEIDTLKNWLTARIAWMDRQLASPCVQTNSVDLPPRVKSGFVRRGDRLVWNQIPFRFRLSGPDGTIVSRQAITDLGSLSSGVWLLAYQNHPGESWEAQRLLKSP